MNLFMMQVYCGSQNLAAGLAVMNSSWYSVLSPVTWVCCGWILVMVMMEWKIQLGNS